MSNTFTDSQLTYLVHFHGRSYPLVADLIERLALGCIPDNKAAMTNLHAAALSIIMTADRLVFMDGKLRAEDFDADALAEMHLVAAHIRELHIRISYGDLSIKEDQRTAVAGAIEGAWAFYDKQHEKSMTKRERLAWFEAAMRARVRNMDMDELPTLLWDGWETVRFRSFAEINIDETARRTGITESDLRAFRENKARPTKEQWRLMIEANYMEAAVTRARATYC
jgi:hypothetical protein